MLTMSRSGITSFAVALVMVATVMVRRQSGASRRALAFGYLVFLVIAVVSWVGLDQPVGDSRRWTSTASTNARPLAAEGRLLLGIPILLAILAFCWEVRRRLRGNGAGGHRAAVDG